MALGIELVPGRSCGECTLCCTNLAIDTKEYRKVPGVPCAHLCAQGCGIYDTRYPVCRTYFCGWRCMDALGEEWRPDRSGILFDALPDEELPAQYRAGGRNLRITLFGRPSC